MFTALHNCSTDTINSQSTYGTELCSTHSHLNNNNKNQSINDNLESAYFCD